MANPYTSILVVDDARFSTTVITRTLQMGGYKNIRRAASATEALAVQEQDPASILIVDWLMPGMDGLELTQQIRQMDESINRYTYVIMLTAKDGVDALKHAFDEGVDDFVNKSSMQEQLLPRIFAAERLVDNQNRLLSQCQELVEVNRGLQRLCNIDPLTGLGNSVYGIEKLEDTLRHTESRGGATSLLLIELQNYEVMKRQQAKQVFDELVVGVSRRLRSLMRPLDSVVRFRDNRFLIITHQDDIAQASAKTFRRIQEGINLRAFKTTSGYHSLQVAISIASASSEFGMPDSDALIRLAEEGIDEAKASGRIVIQYFREL